MLQFMKNKILIPALILTGLAVFFSFRYAGGNDGESGEQEQKTILQTVMGIMDQGHFSPRPIDDAFSQSIYDKTLENLDYEKKFFFQSDIDGLAGYRNQIDDEIKGNSLEFYDKVNALFVKRVTEAEHYYKESLQKPFTFTANDSIQLDGKKLAYAKNDAEMKARWMLP